MYLYRFHSQKKGWATYSTLLKIQFLCRWYNFILLYLSAALYIKNLSALNWPVVSKSFGTADIHDTVGGEYRVIHINVFFVSCPHAHVVYPLKWPHFFLCSLLQVYPVRSLFGHGHVSQRLSYSLAGSSFNLTMPNRNLSLDLLCHSLHRTTFAEK